MINISAFELAHKKYAAKEMPFLTELLGKVKQNNPYKGLKILHNTPLTIEAVLKIEPLVLGGADVTASCITLLPPQEEALQILRAANVKIQLEHQFSGEYDFHLDCCGELIHATPPKIGAIELTQTGSELYKQAKLAYPVLSVDDSEIKMLETFFGTGDGFTRALYEYAGKEMYDKSYVVFGFGKVGKGIVYSLRKFKNTKVTIIDVNKGISDTGSDPNVKFINANELAKIKEVIKTAYCVITATGKEGLISDHYKLKKKDFGEAILTNMGAADEYGKNFEKKDVLFEKKPLNFSISEPTTMKYLDPIFYAHNFGVDIMMGQKIHCGYNPFPADISTDILNKWQEINQENLEMFSSL